MAAESMRWLAVEIMKFDERWYLARVTLAMALLRNLNLNNLASSFIRHHRFVGEIGKASVGGCRLA